MEKHKIEINFTSFDDENALNPSDKEVLEAAVSAVQYSYSPYSNFKVGAAALLGNGEIVLGSNQENASFPAGICAERAAIYCAAHQFKNEIIKTIAITVYTEEFQVLSPIAPCGVCRQVMLETELKQKSDIKIILRGTKGKIYTLSNCKSLLPIYFFEKGLKKEN